MHNAEEAEGVTQILAEVFQLLVTVILELVQTSVHLVESFLISVKAKKIKRQRLVCNYHNIQF